MPIQLAVQHQSVSSHRANDNMLPSDKSSAKEVTVSLKCGLLRGQHLVGDFQFVTWSYNEQKPYLTYPGLATRIKNAFPNVSEPFHIILIDDDNDRIVLPGDDMRETIAALNCFRHRYPAPLRVFLQLPPEPLKENEKREQPIQTPSMETCNELMSVVKSLAENVEKINETNDDIASAVRSHIEKLEKIHETLRHFNEEVSSLLLKQIVNQNKARESDNQAASIRAHASDESIGPASSPSNIQPTSSSIARSESSSSDQSNYEEDDWTPVDHGYGATPRRRRRLTTTSSCASQEPLKEDIMQLMADEFDTVMMGFQRNP